MALSSIQRKSLEAELRKKQKAILSASPVDKIVLGRRIGEIAAELAASPQAPAAERRDFESVSGVGMVSAVKFRYGDGYGVSWASTSIAEADSMERAAAIARAVAESGADNIKDMRKVAEELKPGPQTETAAFKAWFGNSKVIDADGKPMVMYHATYRGGFSEFDRMSSATTRRVSMDTVGVWFTNNPGEGGAAMYAHGEGASIYPAFLRAERIKYYDRFEDFLREMHAAEGRDYDTEQVKGLGSAEGLREKLKGEGYDAISFIGNNVGGLMQDVKELQDAIDRATIEYRDEARRMREVGQEMTAKDGAPFQAKIDRLVEQRQRIEAEISFFGRSTEFDNQLVVVVFEPNQIKSAIGNKGSFDPDSPSIMDSATRYRRTWRTEEP